MSSGTSNGTPSDSPSSLSALRRVLARATTADEYRHLIDAYGPVSPADLASLIDDLYASGTPAAHATALFDAATIQDPPVPATHQPFAAYDPFQNRTYGEVGADLVGDTPVTTDPKVFPVVAEVKQAFEREYLARIGGPDTSGIAYTALPEDPTCLVRCPNDGTTMVAALKEAYRRAGLVTARLEETPDAAEPGLDAALRTVYAAVKSATRTDDFGTVVLPVRDVLLACGLGTHLELIDIERGVHYPDDDTQYSESPVLLRGVAPFEGAGFAALRDATLGPDVAGYEPTAHLDTIVDALTDAVVSLSTTPSVDAAHRTWQVE